MLNFWLNMNLTTLSEILEKVYNTLGNKYLTSNFITEPFDFKVKVVYNRDNPYCDYEIQVYSTPDIPDQFFYKPEIKEKKGLDGIHISVLAHEFKDYIKYIDPTSKMYFGIRFMNEKK